MRTLIGIAVVIGVFLTASVAAAKVYRCTPLKKHVCDLTHCSVLKIGGNGSIKDYWLLNSETGETTYCDKSTVPKCKGPRPNQVRKFIGGGIALDTPSINWWDGEGGLHVMSETDGSWNFSSPAVMLALPNFEKQIKTTITFGFCH